MSICKGLNCKAVDGAGHSIECLMDHNLAFYHNAGNNNPDYRYKGYTNEPLGKATDEQQAAWWEGRKASLYPPDNSISAKENVGKDALILELVEALEVLIKDISSVHALHLNNNVGASTRRALNKSFDILAKAKG